MKKRLLNGLLFLIALLGWAGHEVVAQNRIDLTIKYNTTTSLYEVYGRPNFTDPAFGVGAGTQISVVLPASVPDNALTITSVNGGAWSDASKVYAPAADPAEDFHGIATAGNYVSLTSGQEILFFTFGVTGACLPGIRLFDNATDPSSSAAGFSGGDYKNYIGDALNFGNDVYGSNYTTPGGLCGIPPTIGFTSPANGTKTTITPTISGTTTPGASVTVGEGGTTICSTTATASGTWSCPNPTPFSAGPHTLTVVASNASGNSPTVTTSFTAVQQPTIAITGPVPGTTTTTTPTISGTATPGSSVTVGEGGNTLCTATANASGAYSCSFTLPTGPHNVTAVTGNEGGSSNPASTSFTVAGPPTVVITGPANGTTTNTTPTVSGTATPGASVTVGENGNTLCTTTATASGVWSCSGITLPTGPHTVTAVASNGGGTSNLATTSFTAVGLPTIALTGPANGTTTNTTPTISGTATPGSSVTVGENGTILCTTTASASGAWSCSGVSLPAGPQTLTAVAGNNGGTSNPITTSFTAVGSPAVAIVSPANGTTATTTPTIAGTATPGASVTVGENNNALCTTTASASGAWSCSGITLPTGPHTVTAVVSNSGGNSPVATTNFTVVPNSSTLVSGPSAVFNDLNGNCTADANENLSGLPTPLYAKLINTATPTVAQQAVAIASNGSYTFSGIADGSYTIIIDDNATTSDVTPLAGYTNTSRGTYVANNGVITAPTQAQFCLQSICPPFTLPTLSK